MGAAEPVFPRVLRVLPEYLVQIQITVNPVWVKCVVSLLPETLVPAIAVRVGRVRVRVCPVVYLQKLPFLLTMVIAEL